MPCARRRWFTATRLGLALLALVIALGSGLRARADSELDDQGAAQKAAAAHFERGVEFYRDGSLDAALVEFERAYELIPSVRLLFNLGQIQAERHDYAAALDLFERYTASSDPEIPEARRAEAQQEVGRLRTRVAYLWVSSDVGGAQLFLNDVPVAQLPLTKALAINPGVCNVRLEKAGYQPAQQALKVAAGERPKLQLDLAPDSSTPPVAVSSTGSADQKRDAPKRGDVTYTPFWITSATTLALGGAALGLGLMAREADRTLSEALSQVPTDPDRTADARSDLKLYSALTDSFIALSVVGLGASIYLLIKPPRSRASSLRTQASRPAIQVLPGHRGVAVRATF
ncbi:MAG TPA: PEGA domain-containing protein [Polyangiales bacterium]